MAESFTHINEKTNQSGRSKNTSNDFFFQPKLTINQPDDQYEREADSVAEQVMRMPVNKNENHFFKTVSINSIQRKCAECEEEELQRKEDSPREAIAGNELESYVRSINSGGNSLPNNTKSFFEPRFGYDFSNVRIHNNSIAAKSAQSINALAYTSGNNIVFNQNQYSPETDSGKKLLAHELTHIVQQGANPQSKVVQFQLSENSISNSERQQQLDDLQTRIITITNDSFSLRNELAQLPPTSSEMRNNITQQLNSTRMILIEELERRIQLILEELDSLNQRLGPYPVSSEEYPESEQLGNELLQREQELRENQQQLRPLKRWQMRTEIESVNLEISEIDNELATLPSVCDPLNPRNNLLILRRNELELRKSGLVTSLTSTAHEYEQGDPQWGAIRYGQSSQCTNIQAAGCGPTSLAIVLNYLYQEDPEGLAASGVIEIVTPPQTAQYAETHGRVCNSGTAGDTMVTDVHTGWPGFNGRRIDLAEATQNLREGNLIIFLCKNCTGTRRSGQLRNYGGHFMVLSSVNENGTIYNVLDPGANDSKDIETISQAELQNHTNGFWIIERQ